MADLYSIYRAEPEADRWHVDVGDEVVIDELIVLPNTLSTLDIHHRPNGCNICEYKTTGTGFVPDWYPSFARVAVMAEAAGETEIMEKQPLVGATGRWFFYLIESMGWQRADIAVFNTLRCRPDKNNYPIAKLRFDAERRCRQYDNVHGTSMREGGLASWDADCLVFSFHPAMVLRSQNMAPLLGNKLGDEFQGVMAKAFRLAEAGRRPLVLLGDKAKELIAPEFGEGITKWVGHIEDLKPGELRKRLKAVPLRNDIPKWWEAVR